MVLHLLRVLMKSCCTDRALLLRLVMVQIAGAITVNTVPRLNRSSLSVIVLRTEFRFFHSSTFHLV